MTGSPFALMRYARPLIDALAGPRIHIAGMRLEVPGTLPVRLSVVAGNVRMHRLMQAFVRPGDTVVDVGANIGYNALFAARLVGPGGRVLALEPAGDNLAVMRRNVAAAGATNVDVRAVAAGAANGTREFYLRGDVSAVNSFYRQSMYAAVTGVVRVDVRRLDEICATTPRLVKIDVEGAELEVLEGMPVLLAAPAITLIVEWHPVLQEAAGYRTDALPRELLARGFALRAVSHTSTRVLESGDVAGLAAHLHRSGHPVELVATRRHSRSAR